MAIRETITVSVTPELRIFIRERLKSGHYGNASEVVRAGLRLLIERDQAVSRADALHPKDATML
jgi:putative addiction module CopG family antidote